MVEWKGKEYKFRKCLLYGDRMFLWGLLGIHKRDLTKPMNTQTNIFENMSPEDLREFSCRVISYSLEEPKMSYDEVKNNTDPSFPGPLFEEATKVFSNSFLQEEDKKKY